MTPGCEERVVAALGKKKLDPIQMRAVLESWKKC